MRGEGGGTEQANYLNIFLGALNFIIKVGVYCYDLQRNFSSML